MIMNLANHSTQIMIFLALFLWGNSLVSASQGNMGREFIEWEDLKPEGHKWPFVIYVVDQNGKGNFTTIQAAVDKVPVNDIYSSRHKILIHPGIYREKLIVTKDYVSFIGLQNRSDETIITWHDKESDKIKNGSTLGVDGSATLTVEGYYFCASEITIENSAVPPAPSKMQAAAALRITGSYSMFYKVRFLGMKNVILDQMGNHYFLNSYIQAADEIITGNSTSLYQDSIIHSLAQGPGVIAVSNRNTPDARAGFAFLNCEINGTGKLLLARALGNYSRVAYSLCDFSDVIAPEGWSDSNDKTKQKSVVFGEYKNTGKGASRRHRVPWSKAFTSSEAMPFLTTGFVFELYNDWLRL